MLVNNNPSIFVRLISAHKNIFSEFSKAYLFGSSLNNECPNDVDILLVYDKYSRDIENKKNAIELFLHNILKLPIDITMLSNQELEQTKFLQKVRLKYLILK